MLPLNVVLLIRAGHKIQTTPRAYFKVEVEGFWVVVGSCFLLGGIWQLVEAEMPLMPILLIAVGVVVIVTTLLRKRPKNESG